MSAKFTRQMTVPEFETLFADDNACKAYLQRRRWPTGVRCPRCGSERIYELKSRPFHWECPDCRKGGAYRFSVLVGTVFENTNIGLRDWFRVIHMMLTSKKGVSALQVQRVMGFGSYRTAHYLCHRVRAGLADPKFRKLVGIVEVDETYIGGSNRNRHKDKKTPGTGPAGKLIVMGAVECKGSVVARVIRHTDTITMEAFVREAVSNKVSLLASDEHAGYRRLHKEFPHQFVRHGQGEYVAGAVHTQTIDGFWSLLKQRCDNSRWGKAEPFLGKQDASPTRDA